MRKRFSCFNMFRCFTVDRGLSKSNTEMLMCDPSTCPTASTGVKLLFMYRKLCINNTTLLLLSCWHSVTHSVGNNVPAAGWGMCSFPLGCECLHSACFWNEELKSRREGVCACVFENVTFWDAVNFCIQNLKFLQIVLMFVITVNLYFLISFYIIVCLGKVPWITFIKNVMNL